MTPPILILKTGETLPAISSARGDFEVWIAEGLGVGSDGVRVCSSYAGDPFPEPGAVSGVVVTGSAAMVSDREPWSEASGEFLVAAVAARVPVLGICYGHQLLAQALGGRVGPNPRGREIGTVRVEGLGVADDPLLSVLDPVTPLHASHVESVLELPEGTHSLASTSLDPHHAFRVGECAWGVQFHPEFDADIMRRYLDGRREQVAAEGLDADALSAAVRETPIGVRVLRRFGELVRDRA